jgi:hypothetical protein
MPHKEFIPSTEFGEFFIYHRLVSIGPAVSLFFSQLTFTGQFVNWPTYIIFDIFHTGSVVSILNWLFHWQFSGNL